MSNPMKYRLVALQQHMVDAYEAACKAENLPQDRLELEMPKVVEKVMDVWKCADQINSDIQRRKMRKLTTDLLRLPADIKRFMEGE